MRGNPTSGIKWFPNILWITGIGLLFALAWLFCTLPRSHLEMHSTLQRESGVRRIQTVSTDSRLWLLTPLELVPLLFPPSPSIFPFPLSPLIRYDRSMTINIAIKRFDV